MRKQNEALNSKCISLQKVIMQKNQRILDPGMQQGNLACGGSQSPPNVV